MTYSYQDEDKTYLGHGPSIGGAVAMLNAISFEAPENIYPHLHSFITKGECDDPAALGGEAKRLSQKVTDPDVKDSLVRLARACAQAKTKIISTH